MDLTKLTPDSIAIDTAIADSAGIPRTNNIDLSLPAEVEAALADYYANVQSPDLLRLLLRIVYIMGERAQLKERMAELAEEAKNI